MTNVKTAISLDAGLFERVESLAQEMQVSRSRLVALALQDFLRKREKERLLAELNAVYDGELSEEDRIVTEFGLRQLAQLSEREP